MTTPITKELREHAEENVKALRLAVKQHAFKDIRDAIEMDLKVAEFALAAMYAEPVADVVAWHKEGEERTCDIRWRRFDVAPGPLFAVAQPTPVVPDAYIRDERGRMMLNGVCEPKIGFGAGWNACRAARLNHQSSNQVSVDAVPDDEIKQRASNCPKCGGHGTYHCPQMLGTVECECTLPTEPVSQAYKLPATRFQQVADLYGITSPTGSETSFTFDGFEASSFAKSGWSVQEYVELERYQQAVTDNSPVIPDGYALVPVEPTKEMIDAGWLHFMGTKNPSSKGTYKAMLAAAPQQVK